MQELDHMLRDIWPSIRRRHLFPELPAPQFAEKIQRVGLEIKEKKISLSRTFTREMSKKLRPREIIAGLLDHAVSHYLYCPWNLTTHLKLYAEAKKILKDRVTARMATDAFMDVVADTRCISNTNTPLPNLYRNLRGSVIEEIIKALYQKLWGKNLGVGGYEEISNQLSLLPYLDRSRWLETVRRFALLLRPYLEAETSRQNECRPFSMGSHGIQQYTEEEIEQSLKELASDAVSPDDFIDIVLDFEDEIAEVLQTKDRGMGIGSGLPFVADVLYYMKLAENFWLPIKKVPIESSGDTYPHHHVPWEVGQPCHDIDPWTSFGKIMPGITQTWKRLEGEIYGKEEKTPDCLVVIDSSSSMTNPGQSLSYAVLGAACACDAYLRNEAQVSVYNFSDATSGGRKILPYTRNRPEIYKTLCHYLGGGTRLDIKDIETLQMNRDPDIFLITDMQIMNLANLIEYFNTCRNRITAVHIGSNEQVYTFRRTLDVRKNVGIFAVENKEDIPRIVLGRVREYLYR